MNTVLTGRPDTISAVPSTAVPPPVPPECDLVMKGGITSGVIYPRLVSELSKVYTFRSIGGTSAGAIAAAAAAAAQLGVHTRKRPDAFRQLDDLPDLLGGQATGAKGSMLLNLFQPQKAFRRHFSLLKSALNAPSKFRLGMRIALGVVWRFPVGAILGAAIGVVIFFASEGIARWLGMLLAIVGLLIGAATEALWFFTRALPGNLFGLCNGMPNRKYGPPALTSWLHDYLNELAGKGDGAPLTFGELWAGRLRSERDSVMHDGKAPKVIELAMITTALNLGRPFRIPFEVDHFYFVEQEWQVLFPPDVVKWLVHHARPSATARALSSNERTFRALPIAQELPVLIGVRMSLSFPILLSTIPLYVVDRSLKENSGRATKATRVLFSDGGICSNFPLHFFDSPLPSRPTFAIDLGDFHPDHPNQRVWLPTALNNHQGIEIFVPTISSSPGLGSIAALLGSIVNTMQNWNDQMQIIMPGFRDRIIHINHRKNEGGLNLNMDPQIIRGLADSGHDAADVLMQAFLQRSQPGAQNAWDNHRRVRVRTLLSSIDQQARRLHAAIARTDAPTWREVVENPDPPSYPYLTEQHRDLALGVLDALDALGDYLNASEIDLGSGAPRPEPEWRGTPRI